ncbi:hypothetical protein [Streptococcus ruminantium]|uniref:Transglutaminase-like domain-containing protein n=1 Tax=Streptococcus ruminantium TaxID=1917441 RepID=A0A2Z5TL93_9STRE|nr:hypothetical protein [Streptococcus ruminantium]BBA92117.1 hypothetical protein SR187_2540 [Streptococcus ruminantium]
MKKSKIIFVLAASILLSTTPVMEIGTNKVYANQSIQEKKYSVEIVKEEKFAEFLEGAKKEANNGEVFVHLLGKENLHRSSAVNLQNITKPEDLFKDDNGNVEANEKYVFVKIDGKHLAGNNRVVIMNAKDVVVSTRQEYEKEFEKRKSKLHEFSYENSQIHSLEKIEDDENLLMLLDAHGVWMGKKIIKSNVSDFEIYSKVLKIENKLTVNYGLNPNHREEGYTENLKFENFKQNDYKIREMIDSAGIKDSDEDREKIKKFAVEMGKIAYDFNTFYSPNHSAEYNLPSDLFAVTKRKRAMCVGFSTTAARAFNLMGIPAYVAGAKVETGQLHAVTRSFYDGKWHTVDLTSSKRAGDTGSGYSELMFDRSEDKYTEIVKNFSPKEALAHIGTLSNAQVMTNTTFENWAKDQKAEDLVLINKDAIYNNAKGKSAVERDPQDQIQERLKRREIEKQKAEELFKQREEQNRIEWEKAEKEKIENKKAQEEELRRLQEQFLEAEKQAASKKETQAEKEYSKANRDKNKTITIGWTKMNNKWYYLLEDGKMAKSKWIYDKNYSSWYYLDKNGEMLTNGWIKHSNGKWYYLLEDGKMAKSKWIYDKKHFSWYYLDKNGEMLTNGWIKHSNGKWYYLLEDGKMAKSKWIYDKNYSSWYYLDKNGEMLTNDWIKHSDNKWYYLLGDGKMAKSRWINGWYINKDGFSEKKQ